MSKAYIYALQDPDGDVRYVGKTTNIRKRLGEHIREARAGGSAARHRWVRSLLDAGSKPKLSVLEVCPDVEWKHRERYWIRLHRERGADLVNATKGGEAMCDMSPVARLHRKMRNMFGDRAPVAFDLWVELAREHPETWGQRLNARAQALLERKVTSG